MSTGRTSKSRLGSRGEDLTEQFLVQQGFKVIARNYRAGHGEIDLIAWEGNVLVFIEVKTATSLAFGEPETWVDEKKQRTIIRTAISYLQHNHIEDTDCRFDVVAVNLSHRQHEIHHYRNAFWVKSEQS